MACTLAAIARAVGGVVVGDENALVDSVAAIDSAGPTALTFLANRRYAPHLATTQAGAVLVQPGERRPQGAVIEVADPYVAFAHALALLHPPDWPAPGTHPQAMVSETAVVQGATVEAGAWVGPGARVHPGAWVQAGAVVGAHATVGPGARLMPNCVVMDRCVVGARAWLNPGAVVGGDGFGFAPSPAGLVKIPQTGVAVVEDDVEVGTNSCVDRPAFGETRVRRGAKLDNLVQVGHAADIGPHSLLVAYAGVAGSSRLGAGTVLAAKAAVLGHRTLGDGVAVGVASVVHDDQPDGARVSGVPAIAHRDWLRAATALAELPGLLKEVRALRRRVADLEAALAGQSDLDGVERPAGDTEDA